MKNFWIYGFMVLALMMSVNAGHVYYNTTCYQESANVSNQAGTDGPCVLNYSGSVTYTVDAASLVDGNWSSGVDSGSQSATSVYFKPLQSQQTRFNILNITPYVRSKLELGSVQERIDQLPQSCYDASPDYINITIYGNRYSSSAYDNFVKCWNGTSWMTIQGLACSTSSCFNPYEEALYWNVTAWRANFTYGNPTIPNRTFLSNNVNDIGININSDEENYTINLLVYCKNYSQSTYSLCQNVSHYVTTPISSYTFTNLNLPSSSEINYSFKTFFNYSKAGLSFDEWQNSTDYYAYIVGKLALSNLSYWKPITANSNYSYIMVSLNPGETRRYYLTNTSTYNKTHNIFTSFNDYDGNTKGTASCTIVSSLSGSCGTASGTLDNTSLYMGMGDTARFDIYGASTKPNYTMHFSIEETVQSSAVYSSSIYGQPQYNYFLNASGAATQLNYYLNPASGSNTNERQILNTSLYDSDGTFIKEYYGTTVYQGCTRWKVLNIVDQLNSTRLRTKTYDGYTGNNPITLSIDENISSVKCTEGTTCSYRNSNTGNGNIITCRLVDNAIAFEAPKTYDTIITNVSQQGSTYIVDVTNPSSETFFNTPIYLSNFNPFVGQNMAVNEVGYDVRTLSYGPINEYQATNGNITIWANVQNDNITGVNATLTMDGSYLYSVLINTGTTNVSKNTLLANGSHTYVWTFTYNSTEYNRISSNIFVDSTSPTISQSDLFNNSKTRINTNSSVLKSINFSMSDPGMLYNYALYIDGALNYSSADALGVTSTYYNTTLNLTNMGIGTHTFAFRATNGKYSALTSSWMNYTFYLYNVTVTDTNSTAANNIYASYIRFDKGTSAYYFGKVARWDNYTTARNTTILTNDSLTNYEIWNVTYTTLNDLSITNHTIYWNWSIGSDNYSTNYVQTNTPLGISNCSNATWAKALFMVFHDEDNQAANLTALNTSLNIYMTIQPLVQGLSISNNITLAMRNSWNYSICIYPNSSVFRADSIFEYYTTGYANRKYYIINMTLSNTTHTLDLYHVNSSRAQNIQFYVYDKSSGDAAPGMYVQLLRYYPELGATKVVEVQKTDATGYAIFHAIPYDIFYAYNVINGESLIYSSSVQTLYNSVKSIPVSLTDNIMKSMQGIGNVYTNVSCVIATKSCNFEWSDTQNLVQTGTLEIYRKNGFGNVLIYNQSVTSAAGNIVYTITENMTGNDYLAIGKIETTTKFSPYVVGKDEFLNSDKLAGWSTLGTVVFGMILLTITMGFVFLDMGPAGMIAGTLLALGLGFFLGWVPLTWVGLITLAIVGIIIILRSRT